MKLNTLTNPVIHTASDDGQPSRGYGRPVHRFYKERGGDGAAGRLQDEAAGR